MPLVDFAFPARCPLCGAALGQQNGLCLSCWQELVPAPAEDEAGLYAACLYNESARKLVLAFKYGGRIALAPLMARLMAARLAAIAPPKERALIFIPVPLHRWRLWRRGFNQSALLARSLVRFRRAALDAEAHKGEGGSAMMPERVMVDGLVRRRHTPPLAGLASAERAKTVSGAIAIKPSRQRDIAAADIVLVDDVVTSGATSRECVAALMAAGANSVVICCFARVSH